MFLRAIDVVLLLPKRFRRIYHHIHHRIQFLIRSPKVLLNLPGHLYWWLELLFYVADLVGIGEIYETLADIVKFNTRPLNEKEKAIADKFFPNSINTTRLRIDEFSFIGPKSHHFAYVSFYTINSWGTLQESIFVHELVHVWQYHRLGSVYIPRALKAQFSQDGYDYGGLPSLVHAMENGNGLEDFNLEQQGDIVADYHRLLNGDETRWGLGSQEDLWVYEQLISGVTKKSHDLAA